MKAEAVRAKPCGLLDVFRFVAWVLISFFPSQFSRKFLASPPLDARQGSPYHAPSDHAPHLPSSPLGNNTDNQHCAACETRWRTVFFSLRGEFSEQIRVSKPSKGVFLH
jgi:hypothetical protein